MSKKKPESDVKQRLLDNPLQAKEKDLRQHMEALKTNLSSSNGANFLAKANEECEFIESTLRDIENYQPKSQAEQTKKEKLMQTYSDEFENALNSFQESQKAQKAQAQVQVHDLFTEEMLRERNERIHTVEIKMTLIAEMLKDFAEMTREQGLKLDLIENNIHEAGENTSGVVDELEIASRRGRTKKRFCMIFLLALFFLVISVLLLLILTRL
ncbi:unnamed protein product [Blepharisma stoltei]|uniref:t-SNARE coiled-coil homology domain-containing protein n=1 Tax=Blepharisma stoltei TaxID=1481888 RepID=A0AAU9J9H3_9CILI|nr:unnamed protein product [Blepharisma stoltei]